MMSKITLATVAALALAAAPSVHAQGGATAQDARKPGNQAVPDEPSGKTVLLDDQEFIPKALEGSMAEVELADLALQKSKNDSVKNFAQQMKKDHSAALSVLTNAATQEGIQPPKQLSAEHQKLKEELSKLDGEEFDRAYMSHMVKDHEEDLALFSAKARTGDGDVAAIAQRMVTVLDRHLNMARSVSQAITTGQELEEQRQGKAPRPAHGPAKQ